jgi:hypothetical protein
MPSTIPVPIGEALCPRGPLRVNRSPAPGMGQSSGSRPVKCSALLHRPLWPATRSGSPVRMWRWRSKSLVIRSLSPASSAELAGGEDRERRAGPHLEQRAHRGIYPPAETHQTASLREGRHRLFAAAHPPAVCRDGRVVVDAERHGRRGTLEAHRDRKRQAGGVCRGSHDAVPHLRRSSSMAQTHHLLMRLATGRWHHRV